MTDLNVSDTEMTEALRTLEDPEVRACIGHLVPGLRHYLAERIETGGFLRACLENDLGAAVGHAHPPFTMDQMSTLLGVIASFPVASRGSRRAVSAWLDGGADGIPDR